jgi:hypothetical protein
MIAPVQIFAMEIAKKPEISGFSTDFFNSPVSGIVLYLHPALFPGSGWFWKFFGTCIRGFYER